MATKKPTVYQRQKARETSYSIKDVASYLGASPVLIRRLATLLALTRKTPNGHLFYRLSPIQAKALIAAYHSRCDKPGAAKLG